MREKLNDLKIKDLVLYGFLFFVFYNFIKFFSVSVTPILSALIFVAILNPVVERLEKLKIPRFIGSAFAVLCLVVFITGIFGFSLPFLYKKINGILSNVDKNKFIEDAIFNLNSYLGSIPIDLKLDKETIVRYLKANINFIDFFTSNILKSSEAILTFFFFSILAICLSFLILKDIDSVKATILDIVPCRARKEFESLVKELNDTVFRYLHGQFLVAVFLFCFYFISLFAFGIKNFIIIAFISALSTFIPYLGFYLASLISFFLISEDVSGIGINSLKLFICLCSGQLIEGNLVTPKIMGHKIGINPVFFIAGTLFCIPIFGFLGIILGTPITIIMSVFIKRLLSVYKNTDIYLN
jgi:predicted PurR-regulated permease PerM